MALKYRYDKTAQAKRPASGEPGLPVSPNDMMRVSSIEKGSQQLIATLKAQHPHIMDYLIRRNGDGSGQFPYTCKETGEKQ